MPTRPRTCPGLGIGRRCSLNELGPYRCVVSFSRFLGRLMIMMASKGHFFTQIPQPMQSSSEIQAILLVGVASTHSLPARGKQGAAVGPPPGASGPWQQRQMVLAPSERWDVLNCHLLTDFDDGAVLLAFLTALSGLAAIRLHNGNTSQLLGVVLLRRHGC